MENIDYKKLGLKCGIEIHQQLDTHKLFCNCTTTMSQEPVDEIGRKLRAVVGELGDVDPAAAQEVMKNKTFLYKAYEGESCLVEADSEPPHNLNSDALGITLTVSSMLNCDIPGEVHVMRKTVVDGSNTTGFQRTALIGLNGYIKSDYGRVGITNICLEEDAAQILDRSDTATVYGLDRLGIPLIEIGTEPDIKTPDQAKEVAGKIGMILRSTGKVKRGLGTIRQDINISIREGARVEIKGSQELKMVPFLVDHEVRRQLSLVNIREKLKKMNFKRVKLQVHDATHIFSKAESKITKGKKIFAMRIPGFEGFLKTRLTPTRTLGNEIAAYVRVRIGAKGFIHTDEMLEKYGLEKHFEELAKELKTKKGDTLIIVAGDKEHSQRTLEAIAGRINQLLAGVPEETRKALPDGNTEYLRPLPGAARMYPETDIPPLGISAGQLKQIKRNMPETWDLMINRFMNQYKLNEELSRQVVNSGLGKSFESIVKIGVEPKLAATTLTVDLRDIRSREAVPIENIKDRHVLETFKAFKSGKLQKQNIIDVLRKCAQNPDEDMEHILEGFKSRGMTPDEIRTLVIETIKEKPKLLKRDKPEKVYMGLVMAKVKGKAPGNVVMKVLAEEIKKRK